MSQHRTALITGANRGLGKAVAEELSGRGLEVVVTARDETEAARTAAEIGNGARWAVLDVTDDDSVKRAAAAVGRIDVLVSNAGVLLDAGTDVLSVPGESVERTLAVNVLGSWRVARAFVPAMAERHWGRVVFVSSATGAFGVGLFGGAPAYSVSKAALNGLTVLLAARTREHGVLVNAVNPGQTRTRMMPYAKQTPERAAVGIANAASLPDDGPTGAFLRADGGRLPW